MCIKTPLERVNIVSPFRSKVSADSKRNSYLCNNIYVRVTTFPKHCDNYQIYPYKQADLCYAILYQKRELKKQ